ncbi:MAG: ArsB/NhaD family transporter, partial [Anaerolineae bacterium]|nr:ArsB/NhaD family transporter [Anaerolineae bacterium]
MKSIGIFLGRFIGPAILLLLLAACVLGGQGENPVLASGAPAVAGRVIDSQGVPVRGVTMRLYLNGAPEPQAEKTTGRDGEFLIDIPNEVVETVRLEIDHPHFEQGVWEAGPGDLQELNMGSAIRLHDITIERRLTIGFWVAAITFLGMLLLIATERLHSAMAALLGVAVVLGVSLVGRPFNDEFYIFGFEQAIDYVDFSVIFLVLGMMIVVGIIEETGVFQWLSYQAYRLSGGRVWLLVIILMLLTAVCSALLDNVTTMLLVAPITLQIALTIGIDPLSLLLPEVLASNIGGISTLIGTPTNILIGSYADISFTGFLTNLTPGVLMAQAALVIYVLLVYRKEYKAASGTPSDALLKRLEDNARISQPDKLRKAGGVFVTVLILFIVGEQFHLQPAVTAILGAVAMLLVVQADIEEMLKVVDWTTLVFFIGLFIVIGAVQEVGLISYIAGALADVVGNNLAVTILVITWASAIFSTLIDNIPFTAAMLPIVRFLSATVPGSNSKVLFYSLSVGSAMGGNGSLIGASANMVT